MDIGGAVKALNEGKKVSRSGWNGKGMYLIKLEGNVLSTPEEFDFVQYCIAMKTASGNLQPGWNASTPDLFALDWEVVN